MAAIKITDKVYSVGVKHPDLKVFDLVMPLSHGTTYNSYLILGEKNVLIDTVKLKFADEFVANLKSVIDPAKIDYIVIQHNELDHSGALMKILSIAPNARVVISKTAESFLTNSFNEKFEYIKVDDTSQIEIGPGRSLQFVSAPFLHWPDTMFTYYADEKILFTCDAFGAHYAQDGGIFDRDMAPGEYENQYFKQFHVYYEIIMRLYSEKVLAAVAKTEKLDIAMIAPSHGPIITNEVRRHIDYYKKWSGMKPAKDMKKVTIVYASMYGSTKKMARRIEELVKNRGIKTYLSEIPFNMTEEYLAEVFSQIATSDGLLLGSSTICATVLKPMWDFLFFLATAELKGKTAGIFGSYGWDPQGMKFMELALTNYKMKLLKDITKVKFVPSEEKLKSCETLVDEFVKLLDENKAPEKSAATA